jgi:hypothetical protein
MKGNRLILNSIPKKNSWTDPEILMVHACFQILVNCVEKEGVFRSTGRKYELEGGDQSDEAKELQVKLKELFKLYRWWKSVGSKIPYDDKDFTEKLTKLIVLRELLWT